MRALRDHWPEYLMEACGLGLFMVSAGVLGVILESPSSPVHAALPDPLVRRGLMGAAMGVTAIGLIYYPWGRQCGAHYNPAVTLTFLRLGKIKLVDACGYVVAQFLGGASGVLFVMALLGGRFSQPPVSFVATLPGSAGVFTAFAAEVVISGLLMLTVLFTSNSPKWSRSTGVFAGLLVATYIAIEAPLSGMSMNPARTLASALPSGLWTAWWVYFTAPPLGMLLAVEAYRALTAYGHTGCAKLNHHPSRRCIFCRLGMQPSALATATESDSACNSAAPLASNPATPA